MEYRLGSDEACNATIYLIWFRAEQCGLAAKFEYCGRFCSTYDKVALIICSFVVDIL